MQSIVLHRTPRRHPWVDFTALIDVILLLVIFFMLSTQYTKRQAIPLSVTAHAKDKENTSAIQPLVAQVVGKGKIWIHTKRYDMKGFGDEVRQRLKKEPKLPIILEAMNQAAVQDMVDALDVVRAAGGAQVQLRHSL